MSARKDVKLGAADSVARLQSHGCRKKKKRKEPVTESAFEHCYFPETAH